MAIDYEYLSDERLIQLSEEEFDSEAMYELATRYRNRQN